MTYCVLLNGTQLMFLAVVLSSSLASLSSSSHVHFLSSFWFLLVGGMTSGQTSVHSAGCVGWLAAICLMVSSRRRYFEDLRWPDIESVVPSRSTYLWTRWLMFLTSGFWSLKSSMSSSSSVHIVDYESLIFEIASLWKTCGCCLLIWSLVPAYPENCCRHTGHMAGSSSWAPSLVLVGFSSSRTSTSRSASWFGSGSDALAVVPPPWLVEGGGVDSDRSSSMLRDWIPDIVSGQVWCHTCPLGCDTYLKRMW